MRVNGECRCPLGKDSKATILFTNFREAFQTLTEIRLGQIRGTDSCFVCNPLILNSSKRCHLRRKVVELPSAPSSVNRRVGPGTAISGVESCGTWEQ
jgi:hypothetical protein